MRFARPSGHGWRPQPPGSGHGTTYSGTCSAPAHACCETRRACSAECKSPHRRYKSSLKISMPHARTALADMRHSVLAKHRSNMTKPCDSQHG